MWKFLFFKNKPIKKQCRRFITFIESNKRAPMAAAYDDESTDDEMGMNLQLAERLRINRTDHIPSNNCRFEDSKDFKQFCNFRRKKQQSRDGRSSSSSSVDTHNEFPLSGMQSAYVLPNKKRQNGDKNLEQFANPKRTCLSDRFPNNSDWRDPKKKGSNHDVCHVGSGSLHHYSEHNGSNRGLHPDKTYEDHLNNLADAEDSDLELPYQFSYPHLSRRNGQNSSSLQSHPSTSNSGMHQEPYNSHPVNSHGAQFIDSGSEDDSKTGIQNGALKGGRQSPDPLFCNKKVLGRKVKKVLDSDDTDDENWQSGYRCKPLVFSSSDSEDESPTKISISHDRSPDYRANHSFSGESTSPHCDRMTTRSHKAGLLSRIHRRSPTRSSYNSACSSFKQHSFPRDGCSSQFLTSATVPVDYQVKNSTSKSCRARRSPRINMPSSSTSSPSSFVPNTSSPGTSVRGRNRMHGSMRGSRGSGNTHPKSVHGQRRSETKSARGRSLSSTRSQREKLNLAATYPDLFDAEDSSEVEFFTANSYSDTETSNESLGGLTINATFVSNPDPRRDRNVVCEHSVNIGSSEDEISVVFSSVPHTVRNSDQRRGARALGRRHGRGAGYRHLQNSQEIVSLSPDPVEQVRQMEEDERFARMLQAQFDAELITPLNPPLVPQDSLLEESDDSIIDPVGDSDSEGAFHSSYFPFVSVLPRRGGVFRMHHRLASRPGTPNIAHPSLIFSNRLADGRNRRRSRNESRAWQIERLFGLSSNALPTGILASFESSEDDYETLLGFTELSGDVPRGLQRAQINRLPTRQFRGGKSSEGAGVAHKRVELNKECQVCLSDYAPGDVLRILPCFHEFHTPCIDPWLKINHTCPVCRVIVNLED